MGCASTKHEESGKQHNRIRKREHLAVLPKHGTRTPGNSSTGVFSGSGTQDGQLFSVSPNHPSISSNSLKKASTSVHSHADCDVTSLEEAAADDVAPRSPQTNNNRSGKRDFMLESMSTEDQSTGFFGNKNSSFNNGGNDGPHDGDVKTPLSSVKSSTSTQHNKHNVSAVSNGGTEMCRPTTADDGHLEEIISL